MLVGVSWLAARNPDEETWPDPKTAGVAGGQCHLVWPSGEAKRPLNGKLGTKFRLAYATRIRGC